MYRQDTGKKILPELGESMWQAGIRDKYNNYFFLISMLLEGHKYSIDEIGFVPAWQAIDLCPISLAPRKPPCLRG